MPVGINQPSNQIKLTNVSLVRMKKGAATSDPVPSSACSHSAQARSASK